MKQFVMQNLFIVIAVAVTVVALAFVVLPVLQVSQANAGGAELEKLYSRVSDAYKVAESPKWVAASDTGIEKIREIQERVILQSLQFSTRFPLLVTGRVPFPAPEPNDRLDFTRFYRDSFDGWLKEMKAGRLPTPAELAPLVANARASSVALGAVPGEDRNLLETVRIRETNERARVRIWAEPSCFDYYLKTTGVSLDDRSMWEAQLNWWVQRDLVEVLKAVNSEPVRVMTVRGLEQGSPPASVLTAPIKELVWVDVNEKYYTGPTESDIVAPAGETALQGAVVTAHKTGAKFDVIHFTFQVVMDPKNLPQLVAAMSSKNFYTLLAVNCATLDRKGVRDVLGGAGGASAAAPVPMPTVVPVPGQESSTVTYNYGRDPVMVVTCKFESLFMKSPQSWRDNTDAGRAKRLAFLRGNPKLVLEVLREPPGPGERREVLLTQEALKNAAGQKVADPIASPAGQKKLDEWLKAAQDDVRDERKLRFVALYEDLMPGLIKSELPGFPGSGPAAKGR